MMDPPQTNSNLEQREASPMWDVLIRVALIGGLVLVCYQVLSPFLTLMVWAIILSVTMYPLHRRLARKVGERQWLASTILVVVGLLLIITPMALLMNSFADSVRSFIGAVQQNTLQIPAPPESVAKWPLVGRQIHDTWAKAHADLPGFVQSMQPKIGELAQRSLAVVARIGSDLLLFLASFLVASILLAYGESGARISKAFFVRVAGTAKGERLVKLSAATIRAVALGVIGVAFIQASLVGLALLLARVPAAGILSLIALGLGIAQVPALIVTLPAIAYIWASGDYSTAAAITYTILLLVTGMADNVLKPLMLGRGVDAPMPVILLGALGGMASRGILGMFVGATMLALGYQIFMGWVDANPEADPVVPEKGQPAVGSEI